MTVEGFAERGMLRVPSTMKGSTMYDYEKTLQQLEQAALAKVDGINAAAAVTGRDAKLLLDKLQLEYTKARTAAATIRNFLK